MLAGLEFFSPSARVYISVVELPEYVLKSQLFDCSFVVAQFKCHRGMGLQGCASEEVPALPFVFSVGVFWNMRMSG